MLKQFNIATLSFRDPAGNEDGWINIATQAQIDEISASITNGGAVWVENGEVKCSGKAPSNYYTFNDKTKKFELSKTKQAEFIERKKENLLNELANKADKLKSNLLIGYPQTEIESFYRQEKEALAWRVDNKVDTPMLKQIARVRGVPFEVLVEKVIEKASQFAVAIGVIIGQRQAFEDRLLALSSQKELDALEKEIEEWTFSAN